MTFGGTRKGRPQAPLGALLAVTLTADSFRLGYGVDLRLDFARAADITLRVLTAPREGPFADVRVGADPS